MLPVQHIKFSQRLVCRPSQLVVTTTHQKIRFAKLSAKLFGKAVSDQKIGKAPTIIELASRSISTSILRLNLSRLMKLHYPLAQFDVQCICIWFVANDNKLNDIRMFDLVRRRFTATTHNEPLSRPVLAERKIFIDSVSGSDRRHTVAVCGRQGIRSKPRIRTLWED